MYGFETVGRMRFSVWYDTAISTKSYSFIPLLYKENKAMMAVSEYFCLPQSHLQNFPSTFRTVPVLLFWSLMCPLYCFNSPPWLWKILQTFCQTFNLTCLNNSSLFPSNPRPGEDEMLSPMYSMVLGWQKF